MSRQAGVLAILALLCGACVAFDPNQPAAPPLAGHYSAIISIHYHNHLESRHDSVAATVLLPDAERYRRHFAGTWVTAAGDSGVIGGMLVWDGTMQVTDFAQPPLVTLQGATFLHRLYPWCDFNQIGTGTLEGRVFGDSLVVTGRASVVCGYQLWERLVGIGTDLDVRLAGSRAVTLLRQ